MTNKKISYSFEPGAKYSIEDVFEDSGKYYYVDKECSTSEGDVEKSCTYFNTYDEMILKLVQTIKNDYMGHISHANSIDTHWDQYVDHGIYSLHVSNDYDHNNDHFCGIHTSKLTTEQAENIKKQVKYLMKHWKYCNRCFNTYPISEFENDNNCKTCCEKEEVYEAELQERERARKEERESIQSGKFFQPWM